MLSGIHCALVGIMAFFLRHKLKDNIIKTAATTINKEEFVKLTSKPFKSNGFIRFIANCSIKSDTSVSLFTLFNTINIADNIDNAGRPTQYGEY